MVLSSKGVSRLPIATACSNGISNSLATFTPKAPVEAGVVFSPRISVSFWTHLRATLSVSLIAYLDMAVTPELRYCGL